MFGEGPNPKMSQYQCLECGYNAKNASKLKTHIDTHRKEKHFHCDICDLTFRQKVHLQGHKESVHISEKPFKCDICDLTFKLRIYLKKHQESIHTTQKPFRCVVCDKSFSVKGSLTAHINYAHVQKDPYECNVCDKSFISKQAFEYHIVTQHQEGGATNLTYHTCEVCNYQTHEIPRLEEHIRVVHQKEKNHQCTICKQKFAYRYSMMNHIKTYALPK